MAAELKAEGNRFYVAKDYPAAYFKYSEAIEVDKQNAVLYANRAACSLAMNKFMDAAADCYEATRLDPKYAKAWARLGASLNNLGQYDGSISAYQEALRSLQTSGQLAATDQNLKRQCETELAAVHARIASGTASIQSRLNNVEAVSNDERPWKRAWSMREELHADVSANASSSAWVMLKAYEDWKTGVDIVNKVRVIQTPQGPGTLAMTGGIMFLTNAILRDHRVFHVEDPDTFLDNYDLQVQAEIDTDKAWSPLDGGAQYVTAEALKRQETGGWDAVRPALSTTVRVWIMRGIVEDSLSANYGAALAFYSQVVEVLEWGRQVWRDVPKEQRGAIFEDTFLRSVRCLRLNMQLKACTEEPTKYSFDEIHQEAKDIIQEVTAAEPPDQADPGLILSFFVYPRAHALVAIAFYHRQLAQSLNSENDKETATVHFRQAADAYTRAATAFPEDDEYHPYFLSCALEMLFHCAVAIRELLAVAARIRAAVPKVTRVWACSAMAASRDAQLLQALNAERELQRVVDAGRATLDSPF